MASQTLAREANESLRNDVDLLEAMLERENLVRAWKRVKANKGAAGIDGRSIAETWEWLKADGWNITREQLRKGTYRPQPVRAKEIPKRSGGMRELGIPTVLDRLIQQALLQVLTPLFDPHFSESSYGFRPKRSAHDAIRQAKKYVDEGRSWVVDIDLENFFDRVNHDKLMMRVARRVQDSRMLRLIRSYLEAGVMRDGVKIGREDGTPQGGPLSPLLANIMLDDLDRFLEKRRHRFCRYADDCNVYVQSQRAAERVMKAMVRYITAELNLRVNGTKSAVDRPWRRKFLGYSFHGGSKVRIASESIERLKRSVRELTKRRRSIDLATRLTQLSRYLRGWMAYFRLSETPSVLRDLDSWIRRRVRLCIWKSWKRAATRMRKLRSFGLTDELARMVAGTRRGLWFVAGMPLLAKALSESWLTEQGLLSLQDRWRTLNAVC
ncbi:MAG: group II intron reverse transcriptase/maturase [Actinobacteria bacterium]|nr:group II intron reverse transcriptase/maturase [Actinomycetota bacterium]